MKNKTRIDVSNLWKKFIIQRENVSYLKERFLRKLIRKKITEEIWALKKVSFKVREGECFGVIGKNASGKTTLLKIIARILKPTKGRIRTKGKIAPFLALGAGFEDEFTGKENIYLQGSLMGLKKRVIDRLYNDIVDFSELYDFMDVKLKNYSEGMKARLAFSIATHVDADIILVDEILAVGDGNFQKKCRDKFEELKKRKKTIIFVSHALGEVKTVCENVLYLHRGEVMDIGPAEKVVTEYENHLKSNFIEYPVLVDNLMKKNKESLSKIFENYGFLQMRNIAFPQVIKKKYDKSPKIVLEFRDEKPRIVNVSLNNHIHSFQISTTTSRNTIHLPIKPEWLMKGDYMISLSIKENEKNINLNYPLYFRVKDE